MAVACPNTAIDRIPESLSWFAVRVKARREAVTALALEGKGYEPFLPIYKSLRQWSDRTHEINVPLFPGYIFCRMDPPRRLPLLVTPGVLYVVGAGGIPLRVEDDEIENIRRVVESGAAVQGCPFLQAGDRVRIQVGALKGVQGILVRLKNSSRLVVSITLLQRSVAVELEGPWVAPL